MPIWLLLCMCILLSGCASAPQMPQAGLKAVTNSDKWILTNHVQETGSGNSSRILADRNGQQYAELAAGTTGQVVYFSDIPTSLGAEAKLRFQFLSTQGTGRLQLEALDNQGRTLGTLGWIMTGRVPADGTKEKWLDRRYDANYKGDWIEQLLDIPALFTQYLPTVKAEKYRVSIIAGEGQHALVNQFDTAIVTAKALEITPVMGGEILAAVGDDIKLGIKVANRSTTTLANIRVGLAEPFGYGWTVNGEPVQTIDKLAPGEERSLVWQLQIRRSSAVNGGQAWPVQCLVNDVPVKSGVTVNVLDPRAGKIFYVMTEDLEPIDGAGYPVAWGNNNSWLDPEEYVVQMVKKAERINAIAEMHGAKWTHYIAWTAVRAAEWAAGQSQRADWSAAVQAIRQSVISQSGKGHEYGIHLHSDYDPDLPGNTISYQPSVDGLWANHLKHGWAHSVAEEGDFYNPASRTGMLYRYQRILDELTADSGQGQLLTARVGSFDFGNGSKDEAVSTRAYRKIGLWGSSDADGNAGGITAGDFGREIYFAATDDINNPAKDITQLGIVEFRPTPRQHISYDNQTAAEMNHKADEGMSSFSPQGQTAAGVHAIIGFTHAMFIMGSGDWKSLEGGQFEQLEKHLAYLQNNYAASGRLIFATASELVRNYLDYYTPEPVAVYGKRLEHNWLYDEYEINLLGSDIPIDQMHPHKISIKYPLYWRDSAFRISIQKNGQALYSTWGLPTPTNDIRFIVDDGSAKYTMKVFHNALLTRLMKYYQRIRL